MLSPCPSTPKFAVLLDLVVPLSWLLLDPVYRFYDNQCKITTVLLCIARYTGHTLPAQHQSELITHFITVLPLDVATDAAVRLKSDVSTTDDIE